MSFKPNDIQLSILSDLDFDNSNEPELITNPFSGKTVKLDQRGTAIYDYVKGCEMAGMYNEEAAQAKAMFAGFYPNEYMLLLD